MITKKRFQFEISVPVINNIDEWKPKFIIIFYLLVVAFGLIWIILGDAWYSRILPFYDSLSYQTRVEAILRAYQTNGWCTVSEYGFWGPSSFLYIPVFMVFAPFLPMTRTVLYIYLIPIHLVALVALFDYIRRKTGSLSLAFMGPFLYLSTVPFGITYYGILDQRMDMSTASFALLLWVTGFDWAENSMSKKKSIIFGIVAGLAFLHRPVISIQVSLLIISIILYAIWVARNTKSEKSTLQSLGLVAFIVLLLSIPWLATNLNYFYNYYIISSPITGQTSMLVSIPAYLKYLEYWIGIKLLWLIAITIGLAILFNRFTLKYFLLSVGAIILPIVPLILSGSNSSIVTQICLAGIGLFPLSFAKEKLPLNYGIRFIAVAIASVMMLTNLVTLTKSVNESDKTERLQVEGLLTNIIQKYPTDKPLYLSGFISVGEGPDAIASVARLDLGYPLYTGAVGFHPSQFGLPPKSIEFSEEELERAAACALQQAYKTSDILILVEPSRVEEEEIQAWLNAHVFSNQLAARMNRIALENERLEDTGIAGMMGVIPVRFYKITSSEVEEISNCPEP